MVYIETFIRAESVHPTKMENIRWAKGSSSMSKPIAHQEGQTYVYLREAKGGIEDAKSMIEGFQERGIKGDYAPGVSINFREMIDKPGVVVLPTNVGIWKLQGRIGETDNV